MEALGDLLQPYKEVVGAVTGLVTVGQMFSGSFLCYDMYRAGGVGDVGIMPFLGGLIMGALNLRFGWILQDRTMITVNLVGIALSILYLTVYYFYSRDKTRVWAQTGLGGAVIAALLGYAHVEDPALLERRFGLIITAFMFYLIASPLLSLGDIIRNKSTAGMPFPIIFSGSIVTFMWLLYGLILKNTFIVVQNVVALALLTFQLSLFVVYPARPAAAAGPAQRPKAD